MGKNLKGKECGKGICQRKDGLYYARFVDKTGKRHEKYLPTLPEARNWIEESKYADAHEDVFVATDTTVDQWFDFWIENIVGDLAPNTLRNYRERYVHNIQPVMGKMMIANVKPMHCNKVFIQMDADYAGSTIRQAYITMGTMLKAAKMNDLIAKHPMDGVQPKVLQKLLGHASIKTTMDRYVHVTSESLDQAVRQFESGRVSQHISPCENGVKMA